MSSQRAVSPATWTELLASTGLAEHGAELNRLARRAAELEARLGPPELGTRVRLALLGGASLDFLRGPFKLALAVRGIWADVHVAGFDQTLPELLDPASATAAFGPDIAVIAFPSAAVAARPERDCTPAEANGAAKLLCKRYLDACRAFHERCGAEIVIDDFAPPFFESLGHLSAKTPSSERNFLRRASTMLGDLAPPFVHLHDVRALVEEIGLAHFVDLRFWYHAKQSVSFEALPAYVASLAGVVAGILGRGRRLVALDLDNTLWGGVVGDDGVDGIEIGEGSATGEAFKALQRYLLELRARGVLLAVCSKNDPDIAMEPFRSHPEMQLHLDDFAAFEASWDPKSDALQRIARDLDLGLDSIVFLDDNPAERFQVRTALPDVAVPELPSDPSGFVTALESGRYFETPFVASEDRARADAYRGRARGSDLASDAGDLEAYLRELRMHAVVRPFQAGSMARIAQLVNKTNQFNLTTRRATRSQLEQIASDPLFVTRTIRLSDRFTDHGLISILIGRRAGTALEIETWLMSCRVLGRRVEHVMLDAAVDAARRAGATELRGTYLPTPRNGVVRELYRDLDFELVTEAPDGSSRWTLALDDHRPSTTPIELEDELR